MARTHTVTTRNVREAAPQSLRMAAIDVGSNSIHMVVAQVDDDGAITTLWRLKEMVGLGRISFPSRRLSREAMDRAILALARFKQAAQQRQCEKIIAVATSAIREAENGGDLIERARRELGLYIRVISGRDEARLIYSAVRHAMPLKNRPHLIIDVGGGSVEFIVGDGTKASLLETRKLGAARMTSRFVKSDPISPTDLKNLLKHFDQEISGLCHDIARLRPVKVIGTSGTLENLAAMLGTAATTNGETHPGVIERDRFAKLLKQLIRSDAAERAKLRGLDDQRRDQILAGALLVNELFERLKFRQIELCPSALREGILLDYLARHVPDLEIRREVPDPRRRSVIDLARKCDWHRRHSEQVTRLCLRFFDELRELHKLGPIERELIEYASLLHDIGWHIGRQGHHKHSMYLILNGDLRNFTETEVRIIANIARYHRKSGPKKTHSEFMELDAESRRVVEAGAALLRVADGLDRSHASVIQDIRCKVMKKKVRVSMTARSDAELEIWGARRKMDVFERVFGRSVSFEVRQK